MIQSFHMKVHGQMRLRQRGRWDWARVLDDGKGASEIDPEFLYEGIESASGEIETEFLDEVKGAVKVEAVILNEVKWQVRLSQCF